MGLGVVKAIKSVIGKGDGSILKAATNLIDNTFTSKEEKAKAKLEFKKELNRHHEAIISEANGLEKAYLEDTQNARNTNTRIQESANASKLAKNIAYILDIVFVSAFLAMLAMILFKDVPETNKEIFYTGFGLLGGYVGSIINYHRGTSAGSKSKQKVLDEISKK